ncbi:MAG: NAD-dependent epimerase/dehydratase family protein [Nitrospinae bacterium]|nr:NAD-dependent epimerase/dehydratase family protein [Nitrospinota bacterium]
MPTSDTTIVSNDMQEIADALGERIQQLEDATILLTGGAGVLGYYLINFFAHANATLLKNKCRVICLDNFIRGVPPWLAPFERSGAIRTVKADITQFDPAALGEIDYIIHAASIASPMYYRQYPIETMDANVIGLRILLDHAAVKMKSARPLKSFLFFSSSEIYGDPPPEFIPTKEDFRGLVSCTGPRACYDESKRYGETLCVNFHQSRGVPVKIARPFNNYGPGLSIDDRRVIPDFCKNILNGQNIVMLSDGSPTRTFCYIADAISGYLLMLLSNHNGESFNIGIETPEISIRNMALTLLNVAERELGIGGLKLITGTSEDKNYLVDNPDRRRPSIEKARRLLGYNPKVSLGEGLRRALLWYSAQIKMGK